MPEKVTASAGCWSVLVVTGSAAEEAVEFIILSAKSVRRLMLLEAAFTSDAPFDSAMVLFKSIIVQSCLPPSQGEVRRHTPTAVGRQSS